MATGHIHPPPPDGDPLATLETALQAAPVPVVEPFVVEDRHVGTAYLMPDGWQVVRQEVGDETAHPARKRGGPKLRTTESFVIYIGEQEESPRLYADPDALTVTAVFDDHVGPDAGWQQFRALLTFGNTPEWRAWDDVDKMFYTAVELAEFVEQWRHTITEPASSTLVKLVRGFRATKAVEFESATDDANGDTTLTYVTTTAAQGRGDITVPETLTLRMAPFDGAPDVEMIARFRYRLDHGSAVFGVVLEQPDLAVREAFDAELETIADDTGLPMFIGACS